MADNLNLDSKELITLAMYDQTAPKWAGTSDGIGPDGKYLWGKAMRSFIRFAEYAALRDEESQNLLEIGFGTGRDAKVLSRLYDYVGIDPSQSFIEVARKATSGMLPAEAFQLMSVYQLRDHFGSNHFDSFWACASLLHCSRDRMPEALRSIWSVMKKGGVGFISLKEGDDEEGKEPDLYDGIPRYFTYWQHEAFAEELNRAGFKILEFRVKPARINFLCYVVQKVNESRPYLDDWETQHGPDR